MDDAHAWGPAPLAEPLRFELEEIVGRMPAAVKIRISIRADNGARVTVTLPPGAALAGARR